jgi:hypothetical protein
VFRADQATVSQSPPTAVGFRLGTHSATRPFIDVRMVIDGGEMRVEETADRVALQRRNDLELPELPPGGTR